MKHLPMVISIKFHSAEDGEGRGFSLWIPLFIIVPLVLIILLALFLLILPFLIISIIVTWEMEWWRYLWHGLPAFFKTMHELPGLKVDVEDKKQKVYIAVD